MPGGPISSPQRTGMSRAQEILLVLCATALTLGVFLGSLILVNRFWPDAAITAEEVLNYVLVFGIACVALPWIQHRSFRHQYRLYFRLPTAQPAGEPVETPPRSSLTVSIVRLGLILAGGALLVLAFGPISHLDRLFAWLQGSGLGALSFRLVEFLMVLSLAGCFLLVGGLALLYQRLGLKKRSQQTGNRQQEANRIWLTCLTGTLALSGGLCLLGSFLIRKYL